MRLWVVVLAVGLGLGTAGPAVAAAPKWRVQPTPLPSYGDASWQDGELSAVSCPTESFCAALGDGDFMGPGLLGAQWNGSSWNVHGVGVDVHSQGFSAGGVSCVTADACYAVAESSNADTNSFAFGLVWNGHGWRKVGIPGELNPNSDVLDGISCSSTRFCMAVGQIGSRLYAVAWNGTKWRVVPVAKNRVQEFDGVSCTAANACTAVGASPGGGELGLVERWDGHSWRVQRTPVVGRARRIHLWSVSCTAGDACLAVGQYGDRAGSNHAFAERWDGRSWRRLTLPNSLHAKLFSVSCTANNACMAIGYARNGAVARSWNGARWTQQPLPTPPGQKSGLGSVSCATATYCMVVGGASSSDPLAISYS
jgi:hypothetical protein